MRKSLAGILFKGIVARTTAADVSDNFYNIGASNPSQVIQPLGTRRLLSTFVSNFNFDKGGIKAVDVLSKRSSGSYAPVPKDAEEEIQFLIGEANRGDLLSQKKLGEIFYHKVAESDPAQLVQKINNLKQSIDWFSMASKQGDQDAKLNLGIIHRSCFAQGIVVGEGSIQDHYEQSEHFFTELDNKDLSKSELRKLTMAKVLKSQSKEDRGSSR